MTHNGVPDEEVEKALQKAVSHALDIGLGHPEVHVYDGDKSLRFVTQAGDRELNSVKHFVQDVPKAILFSPVDYTANAILGFETILAAYSVKH